MSNIRKILLLIIFMFTFPQLLFAYIDPASLNVVWQFLAAILIGLVTAFSFVRSNIVMFVNKLFSKKKDKHAADSISENEVNKS